MKSLDKFLEFHAERLTADRPVPIDLDAVCADIGAVVEEREMIPEAAMQAVGGEFRIYLQSNFKELTGTGLRRRFSLAHELGHTLFYEKHDGELKARKDTPRGEALEAACHKAAALILVPSQRLRTELRERELIGAEAIANLAARFEVSLEAMIRRLHEFGAFNGNWTPILTRRSGETLVIEYAAYAPWLVPHIVAPERGMRFAEWFRAKTQPNGALKKKTHDGTLEAIPKEVTSSLVLFELRHHD